VWFPFPTTTTTTVNIRALHDVIEGQAYILRYVPKGMLTSIVMLSIEQPVADAVTASAFPCTPLPGLPPYPLSRSPSNWSKRAPP
jgi:hypothetical protein